MDGLFRSIYFKEISNGDEFIQGVWHRVSPSMMQMLKAIGLNECKMVWNENKNDMQLKKSELKQLEDVIRVTVPKLRRDTTPSRAGDDRITLTDSFLVY